MISPISLAIAFPMIDPVIVQFGPLAIRWYSLAYIGGLLFAWWYVRRLIRSYVRGSLDPPMSEIEADDFLLWATIGVVAG
ncbi:MAG: prolipoprotein diacylglyceryl transferase, partial [Rhodospirillales bacterium]|nr:prolipoprotein diacylglyceryl transferase [Rhodospirillales bacterium]